MIIATRCYASAAYAVMRCLSVHPSVTFVHSAETNKRIFKKFSPFCSHTILVFLYQTSWQYSNGDVECRCGRQKSWFPTSIWLHRVLSTLRPPGVINMAPLDRGKWQVVTLISGSKQRSLLMTGDDDEMFMTRSLNITPKTTEQHLIVCNDISVAYVTNNKRLCSTFSTIEANYRQTQSITRPLCDSRATCCICWLFSWKHSVVRLVFMKCLTRQLALHVRIFVLHLRHSLVTRTAVFLLDTFFYHRYHSFCIFNSFIGSTAACSQQSL